jgi:pimeloyl-ACP methyl ester carboxylesterase
MRAARGLLDLWVACLLCGCAYSGFPGGASVSSVFPHDHLRKPLLPPGSALYTIDGDDLHVRTLGGREPEPAVVLLSGPTASWHSDSAWFAMLQPLLAQDMRTHAVDRAGQAFSSGGGRGGYAKFGQQLESLLPELSTEPVVVVAFASADLALLRYFESNPDGGRISAVLLVDPDALHPELIEFYAEQAVPFQNPALARYVRDGGYDERARELNESDEAHVLSILPAGSERHFETRYFERVLATRLEHEKIIARFREIARYDQDIRGAAIVPWPAAVTVWSFDTDFELDAVDAAATPDERARYEAWRTLSSEWMAALPGGCHLRSRSREHLAMVAEVPELVSLIQSLRSGAPCPRPRPRPEGT